MQYLAAIREFLDGPAGSTLVLLWFVSAYVATVALAAFLFFGFNIAKLRDAIEADVAAIRARRNRGRPPENERLIEFREGEKEVKAYDARIVETRNKIVAPLLSATLACFVIAPLALGIALGQLASLASNFPDLYYALELEGARNASAVDILVFLFESIGRAVTFGILDAAHLNGHLYEDRLDSVTLSLLIWPLQASAAAYLYISIYEITILRRNMFRWTADRNELAAKLREMKAEFGYQEFYPGILTDRRAQLFGSRPPLPSTGVDTRPPFASPSAEQMPFLKAA